MLQPWINGSARDTFETWRIIKNVPTHNLDTGFVTPDISRNNTLNYSWIITAYDNANHLIDGNAYVANSTFYIFIGLFCVYVLLSVLSDAFFSGWLYNTAISFHNDMITSIINAKTSFFDKTPAGIYIYLCIVYGIVINMRYISGFLWKYYKLLILMLLIFNASYHKQ